MNIKTKGLFKVLVIALSMLFAVALAFGISGAWYNTTREAKGTLSMAKGIVIDYSGFNQGADVWEDNASFNLFASQNGMLPGQSVELYNTKIKANASSIDFYARAKLEYKFFTDVEGLTEVTSQIADYSAFINTPTFAQGWVDSGFGDGWFYYATGATFNTIPSADYVDIFAPGQSLTLNIDAPGFNHQGGGYQYSNEILIKRITVTLTLNALQANTAAAEFNGWEIYVPQVVENSSSQVVEILQNQITLGDVGGAYKLGTGEAGSLAYDTTTLGTTLKIVVAGDSQINANAFENSGLEEIYIGDQEYINGVSSYAARIYSSPATFIIGANAFAGCTNLKLYLSSGVNYTIYTNAIPSGATVYYNGSTISLPTSAGTVGGTTITMQAPLIVTPSSGGGSINYSSDNSKGKYTYEDASGNLWYFNVSKVLKEEYSDIEYYYDDLDGCYYDMEGGLLPDSMFEFGRATINYCEMHDEETSNQSIVVPSSIFNELTGSLNVGSLSSYSNSLFSNRNLVSDVTVSSGITSISGSFRSCVNLESVVIPNTVRTIGGATFNGCSNLSSISSLDFVNNFGRDAFDGCSSLTCIPLSASQLCSRALANVTYINGAWSIFTFTLNFNNCSAIYNNINGLIYARTFDNDYAILVGINQNQSNVEINDYCKIIDCQAFDILAGESNLESVTLPSSLQIIGAEAFASCNRLNSITIPNSVTAIGRGAFSGSGLTEITIPSSITSIGAGAFPYSQLTTMMSNSSKYTVSIDGRCLIENDGDNHTLIAFAGSGANGEYDGIPNSVTSIGGSAFSGCTGLTSVTIPSSVTSIGGSAFSGCTGLTSVELGDSVMTIEGDAFINCTNLSEIIADGPYYLSTNNNKVLIDLQNETIKLVLTNKISGSATIPNSVKTLGSVFADCTGLTSITIPNSVTSIGASAFSGCTGLTSITIPNSVTSIGNYAFRGCSGLTSFSGGSSKYQVIGDGRCLVEVDGNNQTLIAFAQSGLESYSIPSSVTSIGQGAFSSCAGLTEVTIPSSVTSIGSEAFYSCTGLTSITIPSSVTSIGIYAFYGCYKDVTIYGEPNDETIQVGLETVIFAGSRTSGLNIGMHAFFNNQALTTVTFEGDWTGISVSVDYNAFGWCYKLTNLQIPNQD